MTSSRHMKRRLSDSTAAEAPLTGDSAYLSNGSLTTRDEDLVSAAEALTKLTSSASSPVQDEHLDSPSVSSPLSPPSINEGHAVHPIVQSVNSISKLSLVSNAVNYYETSKRNYASFNYAAGIVEKAAMPVFSKIEVNLNNKHQERLEQRARTKKRRVQDRSDRLEIKRRIKFCLHILKLANDRIGAKVYELQDKFKENAEDPEETRAINSPSASSLKNGMSEDEASDFSSGELTAHASNIPDEAQETNNEIVATVKKIVHLISNFRPSSLSVEDPADKENGESDEMRLRSTIREIISNLPVQVSQKLPGTSKAPMQAICFARESLDMISRLTSVFNEQLKKAENWVDGPTDVKSYRVGNTEILCPTEQPNKEQTEKSSADKE